MHITLISGSHRQNSQSSKVAHYLSAQLGLQGVSTDIIDLAGNPLPLWDGLHSKEASSTGKIWQPMLEKLKKAVGFIVIAPEWHGMVPAGLKNFFLFTSQAEMGHKPALIVGVSAGIGGAYVVNELQNSGYKNNRLLYLPEHLIVRNVNNVMNEGAEANSEDAYIRRRAAFALRILLSYAEALKPVRASGLTIDPEFPNGM